MGVDVNDITNYFSGSKANIWDYVSVIVLLLLLLLIIVAALREWRVRVRAQRLAHHHYSKPSKSNTARVTRRKTPRLPIRIPVRATQMGTSEVVEGEVLDLSVGGLRFMLYDPPRLIERGQVYSIHSDSPPLEKFGVHRMKVVNVSMGPSENAPMVHGRWVNLSPDVARELNREIRRRLLYGR